MDKLVLVSKERIHKEISLIMKNGATTNLHNQKQDIEELMKLYKILEGESICIGFESNIEIIWKLEEV